MSECQRWLARGAGTTAALGAELGRRAPGGLVLGLCGPLGAGKTTLVQGVARGLGVPDDLPVTSPTFALVHWYQGRLPLVHVDAFRLAGPGDLPAIDADDWLTEGGLVAVEWADRVAAALPRATLWCHMEHCTPATRELTLIWHTPLPGMRLSAILDPKLNVPGLSLTGNRAGPYGTPG